MSNFVEVGKMGDLREGEMKRIRAEGHDLLLARAEGNYYALDNRCPHLGGNLSRGRLEDTVVTYPLHGSQFDLKNGRIVRWVEGSGIVSKIVRALKSPKPPIVYRVKVEDGKILVEI